MIDLGTWVSGDYETDEPEPADHQHPDDDPDVLKKRRLLN